MKPLGLYQNKVISSLAAIQRPDHRANDYCKMAYYQKNSILARRNTSWNFTRQKRLPISLMVHRSQELAGFVTEPVWSFLNYASLAIIIIARLQDKGHSQHHLTTTSNICDFLLTIKSPFLICQWRGTNEFRETTGLSWNKWSTLHCNKIVTLRQLCK